MRIEKQLVTGDVTLDGNDFIDCVLQDCRVTFHGKQPFSFVRTRIPADTHFACIDHAALVIEFLQLVKGANPQRFEELMAGAPEAIPDPSSTVN